MSSKYKTKNKQSFATVLCIGTLTSLLLSVVLSMIVATLVLNERIGEDAIGLLSRIIMMISSALGCIIAIRLNAEKLAIVSGITGIIYLLILIGTGILFFDGGFHNIWTSIISVTVGCVLSCAICIRGKGSVIKRKRTNR